MIDSQWQRRPNAAVRYGYATIRGQSTLMFVEGLGVGGDDEMPIEYQERSRGAGVGSEEPQTDYWDADPLAVGERVRIRGGGECRAWVHSGVEQLERGRTGTVTYVDRRECIQVSGGRGAHGHFYAVEFDRPIHEHYDEAGQHGSRLVASVYARTELERL